MWNGPTLVGCAWIVLAVAGSLMATQAVGWSGTRSAAISQSLTPWVAIPVAAAGGIGIAAGARVLVVVAALLLAGVVVVVGPAMRFSSRRSAAVEPDLRLFHGNLLFENIALADELAGVILASGADVLAMSEITPHHERALMARGAGTQFPHRSGVVVDGNEGMALWSRVPFVCTAAVPMERRDGVVATLDVGGRVLRIVLAHPAPPMTPAGLRDWGPSMRAIGSVGSRPGPPTVIVADFNASRWHPPFRRLLRSGWRDAHEQVGRGLSTSWPMDRAFPGPFIRLDHSLVGRGLDVAAIEDVDLPGSDHRGFVVDLLFAGRP